QGEAGVVNVVFGPVSSEEPQPHAQMAVERRGSERLGTCVGQILGCGERSRFLLRTAKARPYAVRSGLGSAEGATGVCPPVRQQQIIELNAGRRRGTHIAERPGGATCRIG